MSNLTVLNWSGGKDSTLTLHYMLTEKPYFIHCLLTTVNEAYNRIAMHGVREDLLVTQARSLNLPLYQVRLPEMPSMETYEEAMNFHYEILKGQGVNYAAFGDIFLEDIKQYRETQFNRIGIETVFPLWQKDSLLLVKEFISLGYKTIVVCAREDLKGLCGRVIDQHFLEDLPKDIDPSGENGEFHTFVFDGPIFNEPVHFTVGDLIFRSGYWYVDLVP